MPVHEIECETALTPLKRKVPYAWDLNIYRGCSHACRYCYAIYSKDFTGAEGEAQDLYVVTNIVEKLEAELTSPNWKHEVVNIGGVTDSYQPLEEKYQFMPRILRLLIQTCTPAIISTKSILALRDYDLIDELSRLTYINVAATITSVDEQISREIEPGAASSAARFEMLARFRRTNASVGLHVMPIIPYLTDSRENMEELCRRAADTRVHYLLPGMLYLRGASRKAFFDFIDRRHPELSDKFRTLYATGGAEKEFKNDFYLMLNEMRDRYGISSSYTTPMKEKLKPTA
jgi:DNA repair photolyase